MGAQQCAQETVQLQDKEAIKPKAQVRQTSTLVTAIDSQTMKPRHLNHGKVQIEDVKHEVVVTKTYDEPLQRRRDYMEPWICSGSQEEDGCKHGTGQF